MSRKEKIAAAVFAPLFLAAWFYLACVIFTHAPHSSSHEMTDNEPWNDCLPRYDDGKDDEPLGVKLTRQQEDKDLYHEQRRKAFEDLEKRRRSSN